MQLYGNEPLTGHDMLTATAVGKSALERGGAGGSSIAMVRLPELSTQK